MQNPFPDLVPDEFAALRADIENRGIVYPIVVDQRGDIIDGHQRARIADALGIEPPTLAVEVADDAQRVALGIALNLYRRHLSPKERDEAIRTLRQQGMTQQAIATVTGVSHQTVGRATKDIVHADNVEPLLDTRGRKRSPGRPRKEPEPLPPPPEPTFTAPVIEYPEGEGQPVIDPEEAAQAAAVQELYPPLMRALATVKAMTKEAQDKGLVFNITPEQHRRLRDLARTTAKLVGRFDADIAILHL